MDHLLTRARCGSIADMQLCGPSRWLTKSEALAVERIRPRQHPRHMTSNSRSGTPPRLRRRGRKPYLPSTNHEPSTCFVFQMSSMHTTICIRSWTTSQAPRRRWRKRRRNDGARGHRSTTRMPPPPRHPCLNRLVSKSIPNHRTDGLVREGSEKSLLNVVIVVIEDKTMNNLET